MTKTMTTNPTVYMTEDSAIVLSDDNILAIRQLGRIEVWSASGETHMGNLPTDATETQIRTVSAFWILGYVNGVAIGRKDAQAKIREALGLGK